MSNPNRPLFPQPFDSTGISNLMQNAAGTPQQRFPTPSSAYPPEEIHGGTPILMPTPDAPLRHPSGHFPAYQPIQGSVRTHPEFPTPQVQDTRVPTTSSFPPTPMVQRSETTHMPGHLNNTQVAPRPYSSYPLQAPNMSHSPSQRGSGVSGAAHITPRVQRNQDDSEDEGHEVNQGILAMHDGSVRPKSPPKRPVDTVPSLVDFGHSVSVSA